MPAQRIADKCGSSYQKAPPRRCGGRRERGRVMYHSYPFLFDCSKLMHPLRRAFASGSAFTSLTETKLPRRARRSSSRVRFSRGVALVAGGRCSRTGAPVGMTRRRSASSACRRRWRPRRPAWPTATARCARRCRWCRTRACSRSSGCAWPSCARSSGRASPTATCTPSATSCCVTARRPRRPSSTLTPNPHPEP